MKFLFRITEVNKALLIKYPYAALDGSLTVLIKEVMFFDNEGISLLDFAMCVGKWLKEIATGSFLDFDYSSNEYEENPVLHFSRINNHYYTLHSAWVESYADNILGLGEITHCLRIFLQELDTYMQQEYGVAFSNIPLLTLH
ncbi:hypothetical protein GO988_13915 [Hymenobacter sp. HMF4947]|uniref:DUF7878 domain-containing protein n=1 Tax=Hymenobacter ginkgonis TaxID=2682976 RepID=A0A7K1TG91_9BACT|nr:hypothetical protein [Hymenobacter ginkgonis]MVN77427.1 hypothetical protein [Hymenobacter ginkgonis]